MPALTVLSGIGAKDSYRETKVSIRRQPNEKKPFLFRLERLSSDRCAGFYRGYPENTGCCYPEKRREAGFFV